MLATKILTHIQDAFARLLQQYKSIKKQYTLPTPATGGTLLVSAFGALLGSLIDQIQALENSTFDLNEKRQLFNGTTFPALGAQLDGIGQLVGESRNGLSDTEYLIFILGAIARNTSDTTIQTMTNLVSLLFQISTLMAFEMFPAEMNFQVVETSLLRSFLYPIVMNIIQTSLGAGIGLGFVSLYPNNAFQFSSVGGPSIGGGFGDLLDLTAGGGFAANIYNNIGA